MLSNKQKSECQSCGISLEKGEGFAYEDKTTSCRWALCVKNTASTKEYKKYISDSKRETGKSINEVGFLTYNPPPSGKALDLLNSIPGIKKSGNGWQVSCEKKDKRRILEIAEQLQIHVVPAFNAIVRDDEELELIREAKDAGLFKYQIQSLEWLIDRKENCMLALDMGLGKTVTAIAAFPKRGRILVVSPTQVVINWCKETTKWRSDYKTVSIKGSKNFRFPEEGELVSVSYDSLPKWLIPEGKKRSIDLTPEQKEALESTWIIYDEIQALTNSKSQRSKKCKMLSKYAKRSIGLTGTPLKNKPLELYNVLSVLSLNKEAFGTFFDFVRLFGGRKGPFSWEFDGEISPEVPSRLRRVMLRKKKTDPEIEIQLPSKTYIPIEAKTSNKTKKAMDSAWDLYREASGGDLTKELPDISEMAKVKKLIAQENLKVSLGEIEMYESSETPLVFGSAHREPVLEVGNREGWGMIIGGMSAVEKQKVVDDFQAGKLKGIAVSLLAGNSGITLTKASHLLFNDLDWTPNSNEQFEDRIARIGQVEQTVFIKYVVQDHPLMQHIYKLNYQKKKMSHDAIDAVITEEDVADQVHLPAEKFHEDSKEFLEKRKQEAKENEESEIHKLIDIIIGQLMQRFPCEKAKRGVKKTAISFCQEYADAKEEDQPEHYQVVKLFVENNYFTSESRKVLTSILGQGKISS